MIEIYKIMRGTDRVDIKNLYSRVEISNTKRYCYKVSGECLMEMCGAIFMTRCGDPEPIAKGCGGGRYGGGI